MFETNELEVLRQAVEIIKSKLMIDREVMEEEDIDKMQKNIRDLNCMISKRQRELYIEQLKDFKDHMDASLNGMFTDIQEQIDEFYSLKFEVTFNSKTVTLVNGADVFNAIYSCIEDEINEQA